MNSLFILTRTEICKQVQCSFDTDMEFVYAIVIDRCYIFSLTITTLLYIYEYKYRRRINQTILLPNGSTETLSSYFRTLCLKVIFFLFTPDEKIPVFLNNRYSVSNSSG